MSYDHNRWDGDAPLLIPDAIQFDGSFALVPDGADPHWLLATVAAAMAFGGVVRRDASRPFIGGECRTHESRGGFRANLTTALLVGAGANLGLPMSTTHVATGAIAGLAREDSSRLNRRTLRDFGLAWTLTPLCAGLVSMLVTQLLAGSLNA